MPPDTPAEAGANPREVVATHWVDVPVVWRSMPSVPEAFALSRSEPERVRLDTVALVVVLFPMMTLVKLAKVATKLAKNPLVLVALEAMRLVVEAFVMVAFVVVEFPKIAFVMLARVATREEMKELVVVALVTIADVADRRPLTDRDEMLVVASTVCPLTVRAVAEAVVRVV